jgi:hypothetical protein
MCAKARKPGIAPLRRVVDTVTNEYGALVDVLECGHRQNVKQDAIGYYYAYRRRCWRCLAALRSKKTGLLMLKCDQCGATDAEE